MQLFDSHGNLGKILTDMIKFRELVGGLKAERKPGITFPVKSAKDLLERVREAADELKMPVAGGIVETSTQLLGPITVFGKDAIGCHTVVKIRFMSSDGTYMDFCGSGHGTSTDDKAGGKALTYAWKSAGIYGMILPDKEMVDTDDESGQIGKVPTKATITPTKNKWGK